MNIHTLKINWGKFRYSFHFGIFIQWSLFEIILNIHYFTRIIFASLRGTLYDMYISRVAFLILLRTFVMSVIKIHRHIMLELIKNVDRVPTLP